MKVKLNFWTKTSQEPKQNLDRIQGAPIAPFLLEMHIPLQTQNEIEDLWQIKLSFRPRQNLKFWFKCSY